MSSRIAWDLRAQVHGDALALAREHLLYEWTDELDDEAERFLRSLLDRLNAEDLLIWLARRGTDARDLPDHATPSMDLAKRFLAQWNPAQGFEMTTFGQGFWHRGAALYAIDSDIWGEIAPEMIERLAQLPPSGGVESTRWMLAASMRGCPRYAALGDLLKPLDVPIAARFGAATAPRHDALLALVQVRRDPAACDKMLIERARQGAAAGNFEALGLLDALGILDRVDPLAVLPSRVALPFEEPLFHEAQEDECDETARLPNGEYPISLALRWPGAGRAVAEEWVRSVLLDALARGNDPQQVARYLFGRRYPHDSSPAREALATWLRAPSTFDRLVRASIEAEVPLPLAWVTIVRDLLAAIGGAWMRALRWLAHELSEAHRERDGRASNERAYDLPDGFDAPLEFTPPVAGVESRYRAMWWIALEAPLAPDCDESLATLLELAIARLLDSRRRGRSRHMPMDFDPLPKLVWLRAASMPAHPNRRARLLEALRANPLLLRSADVREALERFAPFEPAEVPRFACRLIDGDELREVLTWYDRHGGDVARAAMATALEAMLPDAEALEPFVLTFTAVCAKGRDVTWRRAALASLSSRHLGWLVAYRDRIEAALELPLDLASIARDQLHGSESFSALPEAPEFVPSLLERLRYLAGPGVAKCSGWEHCEVLVLARRLVASSAPKEELTGLLVSLVGTEAEDHAVALLDMLADLGVSRASLLEMALKRIVQHPSEPGFESHSNATMWLARRMTTRSAWERDGASVVAALLETAPNALARLAHHAVYFATQGKAEETLRGVCDAILTTFAQCFAGRAREALDARNDARAKDYLLALMELDAPSFAMRFVRPLRKHPGVAGEVATTLDACDQQLRHDTGRVSSPDNVARALRTLLRRASARERATA